MQNVLGRYPMSGTMLAHRRLRPFRNARLVWEDDYPAVQLLIERMCQVWGGVGDLLVPLSREGTVDEAHLELLQHSELDTLSSRALGPTEGDVQERCEQLAKQIRLPLRQRLQEVPVLLVVATREREKLRPVTVTQLPNHDPWELAYTTMLGRLPDDPTPDLLAFSRARDDLRFEEVLEVQREIAHTPGPEDLAVRSRQVSPVGLSRTGLSPQRSPWTSNALDGWLADSQQSARSLGPGVCVLYEPGNVADACLLWNLRASHGWRPMLPIAVPVPRRDGAVNGDELHSLIQTMIAQPLVGESRWLPGMALTSASLAEEHLEAVAAKFPPHRMYVLAPGEALVPGSAPLTRPSTTTLTFNAGRALVTTLTSEDRDVLSLLDCDASVRLNVSVDRNPIPPVVPLREGRWYPGYSGGGAVIKAAETGVGEVLWPQAWTLLEATAQASGLTVRESVPGRHALALTELAGGPSSVRWLAHRSLLELLHDTAASTSMSWFKKRATLLAQQVAQAQDDPETAMAQFARLIQDVNVSHDAETSGVFDLSALSRTLSSKVSAEAWLRWALHQQLVDRVVNLRCPHCDCAVLRPVEKIGSVQCPRCGRMMADPFGLTSLNFRYRLAEPLRRSLDDDSIYHALIMRWLISALATRPGYLVGAHPGVEFYQDGKQIGEADIVLLRADGSIIPVEVKRRGRQLTAGEVEKLRRIARALKSPAIILGAGDSSADCPDVLRFDNDEEGSCRVVTSDFWLAPYARPTIDGSGLPRWSRAEQAVPQAADHEQDFCTQIIRASDRRFGAEDPVRELL